MQLTITINSLLEVGVVYAAASQGNWNLAKQVSATKVTASPKL